MDERELRLWLKALAEQGWIEQWRWILHAEPGELVTVGTVGYIINGRDYTHEGAVKLVRDFEASTFSG